MRRKTVLEMGIKSNNRRSHIEGLLFCGVLCSFTHSVHCRYRQSIGREAMMRVLL